MARYHLNPESGVPGRCAATADCPFGELETVHYETREAAFAAYEKLTETEPAPAPTKEELSGDDYSAGNIKITALDEAILVGGGAMLPAGGYWIGDPAYAVSKDDNAWQAWVGVAGENSNDFKDPVSGANYNAYPVVGVNTAYGDGYYKDQNGTGYPVDAGMIGAVPVELIEKMGIDKGELDRLGSWVEAADQTLLAREGEGTIVFGELVRIQTIDESDKS